MYKVGDKVCKIKEGKLVEGEIAVVGTTVHKVRYDMGYAIIISKDYDCELIPSPIATIQTWLKDIQDDKELVSGKPDFMEFQATENAYKAVIRLMKGDSNV